ncbi:hypothetical protein F4678DRAFT_313080 [Xylaria arbuscula]|nr:hypothetical protein F4678DRAFT_313080 [Xylaria arbuscula]
MCWFRCSVLSFVIAAIIWTGYLVTPPKADYSESLAELLVFPSHDGRVGFGQAQRRLNQPDQMGLYPTYQRNWRNTGSSVYWKKYVLLVTGLSTAR